MGVHTVIDAHFFHELLERGVNQKAEIMDTVYKNILRLRNIWCHKSRRYIVSIINHILQLQGVAGERGWISHCPRASRSTITLGTSAQAGIVSGLATMWLHTGGCTLWKDLSSTSSIPITYGPGSVGTFNTNGGAIYLSRPPHSRSRPSSPTKNCLKERHCTNYSLLLSKVDILPMKVSMSSRNMFPKETKRLLYWGIPWSHISLGFLHSFKGLEWKITIHEQCVLMVNLIHVECFYRTLNRPHSALNIQYE